jgi:hypothetical protein
MIAKLEQRVTEVPKSGMSPKAELAALNLWLNEPVFVARLLRRLLADDPKLQTMGAQILDAIEERNREVASRSA